MVGNLMIGGLDILGTCFLDRRAPTQSLAYDGGKPWTDSYSAEYRRITRGISSDRTSTMLINACSRAGDVLTAMIYA